MNGHEAQHTCSYTNPRANVTHKRTRPRRSQNPWAATDLFLLTSIVISRRPNVISVIYSLHKPCSASQILINTIERSFLRRSFNPAHRHIPFVTSPAIPRPPITRCSPGASQSQNFAAYASTGCGWRSDPDRPAIGHFDFHTQRRTKNPEAQDHRLPVPGR